MCLPAGTHGDGEPGGRHDEDVDDSLAVDQVVQTEWLVDEVEGFLLLVHPGVRQRHWNM